MGAGWCRVTGLGQAHGVGRRGDVDTLGQVWGWYVYYGVTVD